MGYAAGFLRKFVTMLCGKPGAEDAFTIPPVGASVSIQMGRSPSLEGQALKKSLDRSCRFA